MQTHYEYLQHHLSLPPKESAELCVQGAAETWGRRRKGRRKERRAFPAAAEANSTAVSSLFKATKLGGKDDGRAVLGGPAHGRQRHPASSDEFPPGTHASRHTISSALHRASPSDSILACSLVPGTPPSLAGMSFGIGHSVSPKPWHPKESQAHGRHSVNSCGVNKPVPKSINQSLEEGARRTGKGCK